MKNTIKFNIYKLIILTVSVLFFAGCRPTITVPETLPKNEKVFVTFNASNSRTASPDVNLDVYSYYLTGLNSKNQTVEVASNVTLEKLNQGFAIDIDTYVFTLTAKSGSSAVLQGISSSVDLSKGNTAVSFYMYPVTGGNGNVNLTIEVLDNIGVSKIITGYSTNPAEELASLSNKQTTTLSNAENGKYTVTYSLMNKPSAITQYAHIYLYDNQNKLLGVISESLVIVSGLTSTSTVTIKENDLHRYSTAVYLNKNNAIWRGSNYSVKLVEKNNASCSYNLVDSKGVFTGYVSEGNYSVYVKQESETSYEQTPLEISFEESYAQLNYYTVNINTEKAYSFTAVNAIDVTGEDDTGTVYLVRSDNVFEYSFNIKTGYSTNNYQVLDGDTVISTNLSDNLSIENISEPKIITAKGYIPTVYNINYHVTDSQGAWDDDAVKPLNFTIEDDVYLPTAADFIGNGVILDGWKLSESAADTSAIGYIPADTIEYCKNIDLYPIFKQTAGADTSKKIVYARGISLVIESGGNGITYIYTDLNSDGDHSDSGETQVLAGKVKNFNGYSIIAGDLNDGSYASNITYTMKGGNISSITGFGANASNKSYLYVSGNSVIGSNNKNTNDVTTAVNGVVLNTFTNERINIADSLTGSSELNLITDYVYDTKKAHYVAEMPDSLSSSISFNNIHCFKKNDDNATYKEHSLSIKQSTYEDKCLVKINSDKAVVLPDLSPDSEDHVVIVSTNDNGEVESFSVGPDRIQLKCSVFSISVENGSFKLGNTVLTGGTEYMAQPTPTTYVTEVNTEDSYIYLHVLSSANELTPENASDFLETVVFTPDLNEDGTRKTMKLTVHMEAVPSTDISAAQVVYFNGSFYKRVATKVTWPNAYAGAKQLTFNGLTGYLMNVSSDVENNYLYYIYGAEESWLGGSRLERKSGDFDSDTFDVNDTAGGEYWYWHSGPEAGVKFWNSKAWADVNGLNSTQKADAYKLAATRTIDYEGYGVPDGNGGYVYQHFYNILNIPGANITDIHEPNNSSNETCIEYWKGNTTDKNQYGFWNDKSSGSTFGYFVEFTPYKNQYGEQKTTYDSIVTEATY